MTIVISLIILIILLFENYDWVKDIRNLPTGTSGKVGKAILHVIDNAIGSEGVFGILIIIFIITTKVFVNESKKFNNLKNDIRTKNTLSEKGMRLLEFEWAWNILYKSGADENIRTNIEYLKDVDNCIRQEEYFIKYFPKIFKSKSNIEQFITQYVSKIGDNHKFSDLELEERYQQYRKEYGPVNFWEDILCNKRPLERASWLEQNNHLLK
tara:strand:+ start:221 stop:853 length:633 start_codon:yes stop_codon:yes gene_type:complete